ncbi:MAG TPA: ROK family protein [Bacillota bacterium]|nr:ROK family protein [Bacillota bacterium]
MKTAIVFDVGGTSIRAGLYVKDQGLQGPIIKTNAPNFIDNPLKTELLQEKFTAGCIEVIERIREINALDEVPAVGIAFPGPVNGLGEAVYAPTLWGNIDKPYPLKQILCSRLKSCDITVINDITAAGWRYMEKYHGSFCIITVSSGVGCKVFRQGNLLLNDHYFGGELGHHFYSSEYASIPCDCGSFGHIGAISSGRGIEKLAQFYKQIPKGAFPDSKLWRQDRVLTYDIVKAVAAGDEYALWLLKESIKPLSSAIACLYSFIGMDKYVIIGGFATAIGPLYASLLTQELKKNGLFGLDEKNIDGMVEMGEPDDEHGLIGMGKYIFGR